MADTQFVNSSGWEPDELEALERVKTFRKETASSLFRKLVTEEDARIERRQARARMIRKLEHSQQKVAQA